MPADRAAACFAEVTGPSEETAGWLEGRSAHLCSVWKKSKQPRANLITVDDGNILRFFFFFFFPWEKWQAAGVGEGAFLELKGLL